MDLAKFGVLRPERDHKVCQKHPISVEKVVGNKIGAKTQAPADRVSRKGQKLTYKNILRILVQMRTHNAVDHTHHMPKCENMSI